MVERRLTKAVPVVCASWYSPTPTYHRIGGYEGDGIPLTRCGRTLGQFAPIIRYDHAQMIGCPCRQCFRSNQGAEPHG